MDNSEKKDENELDAIIKTGSVEGDGIHCISIIGQIEGHYILPETQKATKYEHLLPILTERRITL